MTNVFVESTILFHSKSTEHIIFPKLIQETMTRRVSTNEGWHTYAQCWRLNFYWIYQHYKHVRTLLLDISRREYLQARVISITSSCGGVNDISCFVLCLFRVKSFVPCSLNFESFRIFLFGETWVAWWSLSFYPEMMTQFLCFILYILNQLLYSWYRRAILFWSVQI